MPIIRGCVIVYSWHVKETSMSVCLHGCRSLVPMASFYFITFYEQMFFSPSWAQHILLSCWFFFGKFHVFGGGTGCYQTFDICMIRWLLHQWCNITLSILKQLIDQIRLSFANIVPVNFFQLLFVFVTR